MSKILYVDMDGVVADFHGVVDPLLPGVDLGEGDPSTYEERSDMVDKVVQKYPTIFEDLPVIKDSLHYVTLLRALGFEVYFLSTPMCQIPESYMGKRIWIRKHCGLWADKRLILTHRKDLCIGDYLVDDRFKNGAAEFIGEHIHYGSDKFPNWEAVYNYLKDRL